MKIIRQFKPAAKALALGVGNFDGMHTGHRQLIKRLRQEAANARLPTAVLSFEPHPLVVLRPQTPLFRLGSRRDKMEQIAATGVDFLYLARFTQTLAAQTPARFAEILFADMRVRLLVVGVNFRFGCGGGGDVDFLRQAAAVHSAQVLPIKLFTAADGVVSSGRVRDCLRRDDFAAATHLLERPWALNGRVCRGDAFGRKLGFPTANLRLTFVPPCAGVFAARAITADGKNYAAAVNIGTNLAVKKDGVLRVEAHLLNFSGNLYGTHLSLQLRHKLRDEKNYPNMEALRDAIAADVQEVRRLMADK